MYVVLTYTLSTNRHNLSGRTLPSPCAQILDCFKSKTVVGTAIVLDRDIKKAAVEIDQCLQI